MRSVARMAASSLPLELVIDPGLAHSMVLPRRRRLQLTFCHQLTISL